MHLYISYAERSRVSKPSSCPPYRDREKGLSLNSTGLEVYGNGTDFVQRQHKTGGTMDMDEVYAWGQGAKETHPAQRHRRSTKENRASVRIAGARWSQPRAQGLQTSAKAMLPQTSSGTGHTRLATEKWVMERMQKNNTCFCKQRKEAALCNLSL